MLNEAGKVQATLPLCLIMQHAMNEGIDRLAIPDADTIRNDWSVSSHRALYPLEPLYRSLGWPESRSGSCGEVSLHPAIKRTSIPRPFSP
jgi:hypothetical protein